MILENRKSCTNATNLTHLKLLLITQMMYFFRNICTLCLQKIFIEEHYRQLRKLYSITGFFSVVLMCNKWYSLYINIASSHLWYPKY